ncbi:MAG: hypothetical protein B5M56_00585 [Desulfococcus sp. 4484_241]|nr:MAG: hypothetical protein B5M56_00585 [Desulfococcus sp. 4484_241]
MDILHYPFMQHAITAGLIASILCGIMGSLVVVNRIVFLSGGIAHASYGGIGLALFLGMPYLAGAAGFALVSAILMAIVTMKARHRADAIIGVMWAIGMATGVILTDLTPGYNVDLMSYLFGNVLTVPESDLWIMGGMGVLVTLTVIFFYNEFLALSYDQEFARIRGVPVGPLYLLMIGMLAVSIVMVIQVVGLILVIALLTIPPFIMEKRAKSLLHMMVGASLLGAFFTLTGLALSCAFNLTSGASIVLVAGIFFFLSLLTEKINDARAKRV